MADDIRRCADLDERLTPYVDGEAPPDERQQVDVHLATCPPCRADATAESAARDLVREHKSALAEHAPEALRARCAASLQLPASGSGLPAHGSQLPAVGSRVPASAETTAGKPASFIRRWAPLSLAATLVLAVAGVFVFGLNNRVEALAASLAMDHTRCFKVFGTGTEAESGASERTWQHDQGWPIVVPETAPAQQLRLVNVRRCFTTEGRSAHMMYTWRGEPLSVYVLQGDAGRDRIVHKLGTQAVVWCANQRTYAVVAGDTAQDLTSIVDYMKARVR
jgi:anti-sigma factor (TIGR02949 family)